MPAKRRKRTVSDYMSTRKNDYVTCAAVESARKIGNQWHLIIIRYLLERPMRFNELLRVACYLSPVEFPGLNSRCLALHDFTENA
jgi:DNA-binding HxlR family transcriptional regulator